MDGSRHFTIDERISRLKLERAVTPAHLRLTRPIGLIHEDHKVVKKITCMGSGFVGGMFGCLPLCPSLSPMSVLITLLRQQARPPPSLPTNQTSRSLLLTSASHVSKPGSQTLCLSTSQVSMILSKLLETALLRIFRMTRISFHRAPTACMDKPLMAATRSIRGSSSFLQT